MDTFQACFRYVGAVHTQIRLVTCVTQAAYQSYCRNAHDSNTSQRWSFNWSSSDCIAVQYVCMNGASYVSYRFGLWFVVICNCNIKGHMFFGLVPDSVFCETNKRWKETAFDGSSFRVIDPHIPLKNVHFNLTRLNDWIEYDTYLFSGIPCKKYHGLAFMCLLFIPKQKCRVLKCKSHDTDFISFALLLCPARTFTFDLDRGLLAFLSFIRLFLLANYRASFFVSGQTVVLFDVEFYIISMKMTNYIISYISWIIQFIVCYTIYSGRYCYHCGLYDSINLWIAYALFHFMAILVSSDSCTVHVVCQPVFVSALASSFRILRCPNFFIAPCFPPSVHNFTLQLTILPISFEIQWWIPPSFITSFEQHFSVRCSHFHKHWHGGG